MIYPILSDQLFVPISEFESFSQRSNLVTSVANNAFAHSQYFSSQNLPRICYYNPRDTKFVEHLIEQYSRFLTRHPGDINALVNRGYQYTILGKYALARRDYEEVLSIDKQHPGALSGSGIIDFYSNDFTRAQVKLALAVRGEPHNPKFHLALAMVYSKLQKNDKGLEVLQAAEKCPNSNRPDIRADLLRGKVVCYGRMGMLEEAMRCIEEAIPLNPASRNWMTDKAVLLAQMNRLVSSKECFKAILHERPGDVKAYLDLGIVYERLQSFGKASETFTEGLKLAPDHEDMLFRRAYNTLLEQAALPNDGSQAGASYQDHFNAFKDKHPNSPKLKLLRIIKGYYDNEKNDKKISCHFDSYIKNYGNDYFAIFYKASSIKDLRLAVELYTTCLSIDYYDARTRIERAEAYMALGNIAKAKEDLEFCVRYVHIESPEDIDATTVSSVKAYCLLSEIYTSQGEIEKAGCILDDLTELDLDIHRVDLAYGKHLMYLGSYEEAIERLENAAEDRGWQDIEPILLLIQCRRNLGTLKDLEKAWELVLRLIEIDGNKAEVEILKKNIKDEIKAQKLKAADPSVSPVTKRKKNRRKFHPSSNAEPQNAAAVPGESVKIEDETWKALQRQRQEEIEEEQRIQREKFEKEKMQYAYQKKIEAEIKTADREIRIKQRQNKLKGTASNGGAAGKGKTVSLIDDFQKSKQKWLEEERKAIKESAVESVLQPQPAPSPVVTIVKNLLPPGAPSEKQFAPEALRPVQEVYIKPPIKEHPIESSELHKKAEKAKKKESVILMDSKHQASLVKAAQVIDIIKSYLKTSSDGSSDGFLLARALLFNLRKLTKELCPSLDPDQQYSELLNSKVASGSKLSILREQCQSIVIFSSLHVVERFCEQLIASELPKNVAKAVELKGWPQFAKPAPLSELDELSKLSSCLKLTDEGLLRLLKQEVLFLGDLSKNLHHPAAADAFLAAAGAIVQILSKLSDRTFAEKVSKQLKTKDFPLLEENTLSLGVISGLSKRMMLKFRDLQQMVDVYILVDLDKTSI